MNNKIKITNLVCFVLNDLYHSSKKWFLIDLLMNVLVSVFALATTIMFQTVFDNTNLVIQGSETVNHVRVLVIVLCICIISRKFVDILCNYTGTGALAKNAQKYIQKKIHEKIQNIPPVLFEDSDSLDFLDKVNECAEKGYGVYCGISLIVTFFVPYIVLMTGYFFVVLKSLALITIIAIATQLLIQKYKYRFQVQIESSTINIQRRITEYETYLYDIKYYKDTVLYDMFEGFLEKWKALVTEYNSTKRIYEKKSLLINIGSRFVSLLGYTLIYLLLYYNLINGKISVGVFAAIFSSIGALFGMIEGLICFPVQRLSDSLANVSYYYRFMHMDYPPKEQLNGEIKKIELKDVCFKYPNSNRESLKNVTLTINRNETIALVGPNGSGKSTLAKIISGLYSPTSGSVLFDGRINKDEFHFTEMSTAFQNFQKYKLSLKDNIRISDVLSKKDVDVHITNTDLGLHNNMLKDDVLLSREYGGRDLSGGEWQKVAILRALYRNHSIIVLDEPTASIDPVEETKIYKKFLENEDNKIVILLTHRIGAAKFADRIIVLNEGKIVEQGNHEELIAQKGLYYSLYNEQAKWYL